MNKLVQSPIEVISTPSDIASVFLADSTVSNSWKKGEKEHLHASSDTIFVQTLIGKRYYHNTRDWAIHSVLNDLKKNWIDLLDFWNWAFNRWNNTNLCHESWFQTFSENNSKIEALLKSWDFTANDLSDIPVIVWLLLSAWFNNNPIPKTTNSQVTDLLKD